MYEHLGDRPVVQKYGGTSVGSVERIIQIAERVKKQSDQGIKKIAVVVSAMSGETNRLVDLTKQVNPDIDPRNYDMAVAAGEQVSCALMASALQRVGLNSRGFLAYQLGIKTYGNHSRARIEKIDCARLFESWELGIIPVIAGFQGVTEDLEITTLGRGGSDTSAVALAVALNAGFCEINTDVEGVYTADPRSVTKAKPLEVIDFNVMLEMASLGSKVLHSRCVELGAKFKMPIVVRSTFNKNNNSGTSIMDLDDSQKLEAAVVSGITLDKNVAKYTLDGLDEAKGSISDLFEIIADLGINVDIIVHNRKNGESSLRIGFTTEKADHQKTINAIEGWKNQTGQNFKTYVNDKLAKVSAVGLGMRSHPGVASRFFSVLDKAGINIQMVSTSEIKISCVVSEELADKSAGILHDAFI